MPGSVEAEAYPLPLTSQDVTAGWLTAALRSRYPDVTVTGVDILEIIEGTATKLLVSLTYADAAGAAGLPPRMWVKGGFAEHREYVGALGIYAGEVRFFADIAPRYDVHHPASFFALRQDDPVQGIVALEDLRTRGAEFARVTRPLPLGAVAAGLETLAGLHGQSWNQLRPEADGVGLVMGVDADAIWQDWFAELPRYFAAPRSYAAALSLHDPARLRAAATTYRALVQQEPDCLLHGDAHVGNAYLEKDGSVGFVDWQTIAIGPWAHDVNYFLVSSLDHPDRRLHETDLLGHYLKALASHDVPVPTPDEAWEQYRRSTVYGFICWLCNPDIFQPEDVNTATFARFAAAMLDHDTYAALGV